MPPITNRYTSLVGIDHPIVQEGLGPFRTPKLAAAVSAAGGLGTVSMPGMPDDLSSGARTLREHIEECATLTDRPFAVNIPVGVDNGGAVLPFTDIYLRTVLDACSDPSIAARLKVLTTSAGFPGDYIGMIKDAGLTHQHKVGSTRQAVKAAEAGVDVVIAAGFEMGGHAPSKAMHTFVLVPNVTEAVDVPVLLTGGARDARGLAAALAMGADGVAMGTRFIASTDNSDWHPAYVRSLLDSAEGDDVAFDGVYGPCRGLRNPASQRFADEHGDGSGDVESLTRLKLELMQRAQREGDVTDGLVLTGQVASAINDIIQIAEFVPRMAADAAGILTSLASRLSAVPSA